MTNVLVSYGFKSKNTPNMKTGFSDSDEEKLTELGSNTESQLTSTPASASASKYLCCTIIVFFYLACSLFLLKQEKGSLFQSCVLLHSYNIATAQLSIGVSLF